MYPLNLSVEAMKFAVDAEVVDHDQGLHPEGLCRLRPRLEACVAAYRGHLEK